MKKIRMVEWLLVTVALIALVALMSPVQLPVIIFKTAQVTLSGWVGYWFDRGVAPTTRPNNPDLTPMERSAASIRRAIVIGFAMVAGALGA
ncbi:putative holin [Pseudoduganella sp. RAF53_2]|uniref:putative holin n=1 Tax=unclassified Pseudoduganella TaxID=2637179 RepID=UPI003F954824